jgi:soluble lytic murein transglycosylase-like protein
MSIDSVRARIAEIEARIQALSPPIQPAVQQTEQISQLDSQNTNSVNTVQPFNVTLANATGEVKLKQDPGKYSPEIEALIQKYSGMNGLDPNLVRAVIREESDGDPHCVSSKGAMGLMQLMPEELSGYGVKDPFDPEQNIAGGTKQLAQKLKLFNGDISLALAAYNAGTGAVRKYHGIPPFPETQNYVQKVLKMMGSGG